MKINTIAKKQVSHNSYKEIVAFLKDDHAFYLRASFEANLADQKSLPKEPYQAKYLSCIRKRKYFSDWLMNIGRR